MAYNQKEGVYECVISVAEVNEDQPVQLDESQKKTILNHLADLFFAGEISMTEEALAKYNDHESMVKYCKGLLNNWLRKDKRLNGGVKYTAKNPGSRAGSGDSVLKELKKLRIKVEADPAALEQVDKAIADRKQEIEADKKKSIEVDLSKIPAGLRNLVS